MKRMLYGLPGKLFLPLIAAAMIWEYLGAPEWERNIIGVVRFFYCLLLIIAAAGGLVLVGRLTKKDERIAEIKAGQHVDLIGPLSFSRTFFIAMTWVYALIYLGTGNIITGIALIIAAGAGAAHRKGIRTLASQIAAEHPRDLEALPVAGKWSVQKHY